MLFVVYYRDEILYRSEPVGSEVVTSWQRYWKQFFWFLIFTCGTQVLKQSFQNSYSIFGYPPPLPPGFSAKSFVGNPILASFT